MANPLLLSRCARRLEEGKLRRRHPFYLSSKRWRHQHQQANKAVSILFVLLVISIVFLCWYYSFKDGYTALMEAVDNGHAGLVDLLIRHGAKVDLQDKVNDAISTLIPSPSPSTHLATLRCLFCFSSLDSYTSQEIKFTRYGLLISCLFFCSSVHSLETPH